MARVLVVGATGLLGNEVSHRARTAGHQVRVLVRAGSAGRPRLEAFGCEAVEGDLKDGASLDIACRDIDVVVTTANSMLSKRTGDSLESVDRKGSLDLVSAASRARVKRFIYTSVSPQFTDNVPFIRHKREVERAVRASGMTWFILQPTAFMEIHAGPVGGWDLRKGHVRTSGDGRTPIGYISVHDVAAFAAAAITQANGNRDLLLAGPEPLSARDAIQIAERETGKRFKVQRLPLPVLKIARPLVEPFNPTLGSLLSMIVEQEQTPVALPVAPYAEFNVVPTTFADYVRRHVTGQEDS